ncbi:hypothetical protein [Moorena sp. SIO3I6]|uniref:hypothetical protein n=1 Tax=Moorena sp. SIO3I6 TaxID=2607831 RepID=UPI0013C9A91F|nr:hypothetical protein [Moorena sp. SIO3I6]NEO90501.1 hypothetical protein [Moorena sp. SIO3G5]NEP25134.1 hypothetical protein [Moorena sp. SIO3I6]
MFRSISYNNRKHSAVSRQPSAYFIQKLFPYPGLRPMAPQVACVAQASTLGASP